MIDGGIIIANVPDIAMTPTASLLEYPTSFIVGKAAVDMVAVEAVLEPMTAAMKALAMTQAMARPPRTRPSQRSQQTTISRAMPDLAMNCDISTNMGMVNNT